MERSLFEIVESLKTPRILVVGDLVLDRYIWGDADRISPEAPIPILRVVRQEERLGGAAGVAAILRVLEAEVSLVGVLGEDVAGARCRQLLEERQIDAAIIPAVGGQHTTLKERYIGRAEHKHPQQVLRVDYEAEQPLSDEVLRRLSSSLESLIPAHDVVLISDYSKGVCGPELIRAIVEQCRRHQRRVLADPGRQPLDLARFRGCNSLTPNRFEASRATGIVIDTIEAARAAAAHLRADLDLEVGLVTLDRDGMVLADGRGQRHFPARPRQVYDITGAGDVALAMLGLALASGCDYAEAIQLANVAAGLSVEKIGVTTVSRQDILEDLLKHSPKRRDKLMSRDEMALESARLRSAGRRVVFTNGCFDLLHSGHIYLLQEAKRQGDVLIVGLNSDASVRLLGKGDNRPIQDERTRAHVLGALEFVDYVCLFAEETPTELIRALRPHVLVKGADYLPEQVAGRDFVEADGGRLHLVNLQPGQSTSR